MQKGGGAMFKPRLTKPEAGNPYYNTKSNGGYSTAILGNPTDKGCNVLANCVGYAFGRFNEIAGSKEMKYLAPRNAELFVTIAKQQGLTVGQTPKLGAVMCWQKGGTLNGSDGAGHVAVVEQINSDGSVTTSESGYGSKNPFWTAKRSKGNGNWGAGTGYKFLGFIYNPAVKDSDTSTDANACPYPEPTKLIKKGDTGTGVKWLQWYLIKRGYLRQSELDGDFGKITLGAVCAFQLENKLAVDGVCGAKTRAALKR